MSSTLDPVVLPASSEEQVRALQRMMQQGQAALVGPDNTRVEIPEPVYRLLLRILSALEEGKGISLVPVMHELTTQQAANILGVSRPYVVELLNRKEIPFHKAGTHRRIYLRDLLKFKKERDRRRHEAIGRMARHAVDAGVYDKVVSPNE